MSLGVGGILKLLQYDAARNGFPQTVRLVYSTFHSCCSGSQNDFRPVCLHEFAALYAHRLGHRKNQRVALNGRHESQSHAGVAACRLDDGGSWTQQSFLFGILDHSQCDAVFGTSAGVERLNLGDKRPFQPSVL